MKTPSLKTRLANPRNRLVRCYDNGGVDAGGSFDQFTVAYLRPDGTHDRARWFSYRGMSHHPFDPQGFGQSGESRHVPIDFPCSRMGRRNHLGRRIPFTDLPPDCQRLVTQDLAPGKD